MTNAQATSTIYIVDDDEAVRDSLRWLLEANGYRVKSFSGAEEFLQSYDPDQVGVLIVDVRMPGMSGLELQEILIARQAPLPIVFITGHGDVPMAVSTMKKGAVDFLEKPFNESDLREIVARMLEDAKERVEQARARRDQEAVLSRLTAREQQVLERIVAGRLNKQIAGDLNISIKTVEAHRANIMEKLEVTIAADLAKIALTKSEGTRMTAKIIDGKALSATVRAEVAERVKSLREQGIQPGLAVVLVGEDPASQVYVRNKAAACEKAGLYSRVIGLGQDTTEAELLDIVRQLNEDTAIHGILVQLPLPGHMNTAKVIETISADKDVDGFHINNAGLLMTGKPLFRPCTPYGVMRMLESENVPVRGAEAVVVGASNIVGKPMALLLLAAGATVTLCNSKTRDLGAQTRRADILVVATGRPGMVSGDMIKPGAVVIDVGINRLPDGRLVGDVEFESARSVAGAITPVPGGVGPMTIAMLLVNTLEAAERSAAGLMPQTA